MSDGDPDKTNPYHVPAGPPRPSQPRSREACLVVMHGEGIGRRITLGQQRVSVGRARNADLVFEEESVSRNHCQITPLFAHDGMPPEAWSIEDLQSTNGTLVNDEAIARVNLQHGDQVQIGRNICKFLASGHIESAYHEEIYRLMMSDGLTGLANRRAFEDALNRELSRAARYARPLSLLMIDVDHFKRVNDSLGHLAGDAALRQVGATLKSNLRRDDLAARLGGEEFGVLLPEIDRQGAMVTAEKLRRVIEARPFVFEQHRVPLTISLGVATRAVTDTEGVEIVKRADELLYVAKREGRNCVRG